MSGDFFTDVPRRIPYAGPGTKEPLSYAVYDPARIVLGKRLEDQLRIAVCLWHSFNWPGSDVFGVGTFDRPWLAPGVDVATATRTKIDAAFEFIDKLGVPFFTFHDRDVAPEGATYSETRTNLDASVSQIEAHMARTKARLLWGTANLFSHPRYAAGAATNPDPEVFAYAAAQVKTMLEVTHRLKGASYVLWGGREGYETLLNTDLAQEETQLARFLTLVAEHKQRIGFTGALLIEPKPQEPRRPLSRAHRRHRHARPGAARRGRHGRGRHTRRPAQGALRRLVQGARVGDPRRLADAGRPRASRRGRRDRSTAAIRAARAARGSGQPEDLVRRSLAGARGREGRRLRRPAEPRAACADDEELAV